MVITKTPFRISFFGGGTDIPLWFRENGGSVLSVTIDKYCYISCRHLPKFFDHKYRFVYSQIETLTEIEDIKHPSIKAVMNWMNWNEGLEIHHDGDLPARSGLGSSSSFTVGLINALNALQGKYSSKIELALNAIHVEQNIIKEAVGSQDQAAAAFGGLNRIDFFGENSISVNPVILPKLRIEELQRHLLLFFTGVSRFASEIETVKMQNFVNKKLELTKMGEMVSEAISILSDSKKDIKDFGLLLKEGWEYKKSLSSNVSNSEIDFIYDAAMKEGAIGGKILGAGGGGFILFFAPPDNHNQIIEKLAHLTHVPFKFEYDGSSVVLYQPNGL
jgi:D-glycero-alpha-D-manno-heptose-7-phosphate kinase